MQILQHPNDLLREKSLPVERVDDDLRAFAREMYSTMLNAGGVGISAPQVGRLIRAIVILNGTTPLYMFDPVILKASHEKETDMEGCLSFVGTYIPIARPKKVHIRFRNMLNKMEYIILTGVEARAALHEIEHLRGVLLIDHT